MSHVESDTYCERVQHEQGGKMQNHRSKLHLGRALLELEL